MYRAPIDVFVHAGSILGREVLVAPQIGGRGQVEGFLKARKMAPLGESKGTGLERKKANY